MWTAVPLLWSIWMGCAAEREDDVNTDTDPDTDPETDPDTDTDADADADTAVFDTSLQWWYRETGGDTALDSGFDSGDTGFLETGDTEQPWLADTGYALVGLDARASTDGDDEKPTYAGYTGWFWYSSSLDADRCLVWYDALGVPTSTATCPDCDYAWVIAMSYDTEEELYQGDCDWMFGKDRFDPWAMSVGVGIDTWGEDTATDALVGVGPSFYWYGGYWYPWPLFDDSFGWWIEVENGDDLVGWYASITFGYAVYY